MEPPDPEAVMKKYQRNCMKVALNETCNNARQKLKKDCKKIKDHSGVTGNGRQTCKFYDKLDCILGHRPTSTPPVLLDVGSSTIPSSELQSQDPDINGDPEEEIDGRDGM